MVTKAVSIHDPPFSGFFSNDIASSSSKIDTNIDLAASFCNAGNVFSIL